MTSGGRNRVSGRLASRPETLGLPSSAKHQTIPLEKTVLDCVGLMRVVIRE